MLVVLVLALSAGSGAARSTSVSVGVYPSGTTFSASSPAPPHAAPSVSLAMPIGGVDDATILVRGAQKVSITSPTIDSPLQLNLFFAHYVSVDGKPVPDALMPWNGSQHSAEQTNQPLWLQVTVPYGTAPGTYSGSVAVVADGARTALPIAVAVAAEAEPGLRKPAHDVQLLAAVLRQQGGKPLRRRSTDDAPGALQLLRLLPAVSE